MRRDDDEGDRFAQASARGAQDAHRAAQARIGRVVGGSYRLERVCGDGPVGVLFSATHVGLARSVMLLHLRAPPVRDTAIVERAARGLRRVHEIEHPAIAQPRDVIVDRVEGDVYVVLERLDGDTLASHLARRGPLEPEHAITLLAPVLDALAIVHRAGVAHGALAPESVIVGRSARAVPKVIDLGLASLSASLGGSVPKGPFLAPERAIGALASIGPRTDVWSLGALIYSSLAGEPPSGARADAAQVTRGSIVPIELRRPDLPEPVVLALRRALARDPAHRFGDAGELRRALTELEIGADVPPARAAPATPAAGLVAKIAGASIAAAAAISGLAFAASSIDPGERIATVRQPAAIASVASVPRRPIEGVPREPAAHPARRSDCWPDEGEL